MSIKRMNRSRLTFARFVDRYECDPTFRPVILVVMRTLMYFASGERECD